jgi:hypothetical protein
MRGSHGWLAAEGDVVKKPKARLDAWAEAQKRFHLSDLHIQMARELGRHWFRLLQDQSGICI